MRILILILVCAARAAASEFDRFVDAGVAAGSDPRAAIPQLIEAVKAWESSDGKSRLSAVCNQLGIHLLSVGDQKEAEIFFARAVSLAPHKAAPRSNHGASLVRLGRIDQAISEHAEVFRLEPENEGNLRNFCAALLSIEAFARARPYCESSVRLAPDVASPSINLAQVYAELGRHDEAAKAIAAAKAKAGARMIAPDKYYEVGVLRSAEAYVASLAGRGDEGEKLFLEQMKDEPASPLPFAARGRARLRRGDYDGAISDFDKAYAMNPEAMIFVLPQRASANQKAGRPALAAEDRTKACAAGWMPACSRKKKRRVADE